MKKFKRSILALLLCACSAFAVGCASTDDDTSKKDSSSSSSWQEIEGTDEEEVVNAEVKPLKEVYALNERMYPNYLTMEVGGEAVRLRDCQLEFPDGKRYEKQSYQLSMLGQYNLYYSYEQGGKQTTGVKRFKVLNDNYYVTSQNSSATYAVDVPYFAVQSPDNWNKGTVEGAKATGIKVSLAEGDEFKWAKPIKVGEGYNELLDIIIPQMNVNRDSTTIQAPYQAEIVRITLTDCYDSTKTLEIIVDCTCKFGYYWYRTAVNGDIESSINKAAGNGYDYYKNKKYFYIGDDRYICIYGERGGQVGGLMEGAYTMALDTAENNFYVRAPKYETPTLINLLNNEEIHEDESKHFKGFTNGEAYLSIKCENYVASACEFIITDIKGASEEEFKGQKYEDTEVPTIMPAVDLDYVNVVCGETLDVFDATCLDVNLKGDYKVACYYNYGTANQTSVKIEKGKISFPMKGKYALVYTAEDGYGNVAEKVVVLNAREGESISFDENKLSNTKLGEYVTLPEINPVGLNGSVQVESSVTYQEDGTMVALNGNSFMLLNEGKYQIKYKMTDGIYNKEFAYEIDGVANADNVQFLDSLYLPTYLMRGKTYYLDSYNAYTFAQKTPKANETEVYAKVDDGDFARVDNYNRYVVTAQDSVQFKYVYGAKEVLSNVMSVVSVGSGEELNLPGYFVTDGNSTVALSENQSCVVINATADTTVAFANPISFNEFKVNFQIPVDKRAFKKMTFTLTDYQDKSKFVAVSYLNGGSSYQLSVNGTNAAIASLVGKQIILDYFNRSFRTDTSESIPVENVFSTDAVMLTISLEGVSGEAEVQIYQLCNQSLGISWDNGKPIISAKDIAGRYALGETLTVYPADVTDVLSTVDGKGVMLSILKGREAVTLNGVTMKNLPINEVMQIKLPEVGTYHVEYKIEDDAGNVETKRFKIDYVDATPPTIILAEGYYQNAIKNAKLGETITVAGYTVTDNLSAAANLRTTVTVFTPYNEMLVLKDTNTFVAERAGTYKVYYRCLDEGGNLTQVSYVIKVK